MVFAQDSSLWLANNAGASGNLHRFDGKSWVRFGKVISADNQ